MNQMNQLPQIIEHSGQKAVSARDLYQHLGLNKTQWKRWYEKNIINNRFAIEHEDWVGFDMMSNGNATKDFVLYIDFAKRLAMMTRTEQGEKIRQYFVACEERLKKLTQKPLSIEEIIIAQCQEMIECKKRFASIEATQEEHSKKLYLLEAKTTTRPDYFTIAAYARCNKIKINDNQSKFLGRMAASLCKKLGHPIDEVPDRRYGYVYSYPSCVLQEVFDKWTSVN